MEQSNEMNNCTSHFIKHFRHALHTVRIIIIGKSIMQRSSLKVSHIYIL